MFHGWIFPVLLITGGLFFVPGLMSEENVVHGDSSVLPKLDYSKKFDVQSFPGGQDQVEMKTFHTKAANLPEYSGKLNVLEMPMADLPADSRFSNSPLKMKEYEVQKAVEKWTRTTDFQDRKEASNFFKGTVFEKIASDSGKNADQYSKQLTVKEAVQPKILEAEDVSRVINRGGQTGEVQIGKGGFSGVKTLKEFKATPETRSPLK